MIIVPDVFELKGSGVGGFAPLRGLPGVKVHKAGVGFFDGLWAEYEEALASKEAQQPAEEQPTDE